MIAVRYIYPAWAGVPQPGFHLLSRAMVDRRPRLRKGKPGRSAAGRLRTSGSRASHTVSRGREFPGCGEAQN